MSRLIELKDNGDDILQLYRDCVKMEYDVIGENVNYKIVKKESSLYIYFQCTSSKVDWFRNFMFTKRPYSDMKTAWKCHSGFLTSFKQVEDIIKEAINQDGIESIIITGYSHGAALAVLCHEYCWFNKPDIRKNIRGYGFGCPRVIGHFFLKSELKERWENFYVIRNDNDIVTHVPPKLFRFTHVGETYKMGSSLNFHFIKSHYPENYIESIKKELTSDNK